ncbi:hypothetical protein WJX73_002343 [Symbiochloris irregularis]|uniref:type I protein arginine methyltransferase n=1 Tax=Symbiochloris irregularis TaxID=706552 RepID=A0AAW1PFK1_9CHLO
MALTADVILYLEAPVLVVDPSAIDLGPLSAILCKKQPPQGDANDNLLQIRSSRTGHILARGPLSHGKIWPVSAESVRVLLPTLTGQEATFELNCAQAPQAAQELREVMLQRQDSKTEAGSANLYFHYYGMLQHQQNMLQDYVRTATYYAAIMENQADFAGKVVMDVGAGTGILSLFAAQAGARKVYAVEASNMAQYARTLATANPDLGSRIEVLHTKVEDIADSAIEKVDILVSEPMGTLLVNERMLETYLYARDRFLKPGGRMFPRLGRIHVAAFSDECLYAEMVSKATFWIQQHYFGVDLTPLYAPALAGYFSQVVVDAIDPRVLVSECATRAFNFDSIDESELHEINIPLSFQISRMCNVHGLACWFDVLFAGSAAERWLSTAPFLQTTHWFQLRCILQQPLAVQAGAIVSGSMRMVAHDRQSYDIYLILQAPATQPGLPPQIASGKLDLKEPIYRQLQQYQQPTTDPVDSFAPTAGLK